MGEKEKGEKGIGEGVEKDEGLRQAINYVYSLFNYNEHKFYAFIAYTTRG